MLFVWLKCKNILNLYSDCNGEVNNQLVVSFTTYPARIDNVWMVVDSIVRQTMRPFVIELWLSEENFPQKELELPLTLMKYKLRGFLDIKWVKEDLKPHKKYFYSFLQHKDKFVVTIDDDLYYRRDMIALLWKIYEKFPNFLTASLFPVNESLFEHLKLMFIAFVLVSLITFVILKGLL